MKQWKNLKGMNKLVIIGASGHGKVVAEIAKLSGYNEIVFLDDNIEKNYCAGLSIVGKLSEIRNFIDYDLFIAIGSNSVRESIARKLLNFNVVTLIHPQSIISERVKIGKGSVIMPGAVINSDAEIGQFCIINTCSSVDHDSLVGDFSHISVGSHIAGTVSIGNNVFIGAGATVINNLTIGSNSIVGAGAVVIENVSQNSKVIGVPAK